MINQIFKTKYNEDTFTDFIQVLIPSLALDKKRPEARTGFTSIQQLAEASENKLDLVVFVVKLESSLHARVEITKNTYAVLKSHARSNALVAYISDDSDEWRLSLITTKVTRTTDGVRESISNPRRFSYVLGPGAKVATPSKMLQGTVDTISSLENKFSLAVVSKEFYTQIATQYSKLVGGTRGEGRKATVYARILKLGNNNDAVNANFAIRLIGRLVFCWFLKQKKGHLGNPLIPDEILSVGAVKRTGDYYHSICAPLFFEVLNKPQASRPTFFNHAELFHKVPFLNGGLFQDHTEDNHKFNRTTGLSERRGVVDVPDIWFSELFQIFEEYNFTIDENTSIDTELSIDPEMLGRIFENLLAEVNPETGASARKSTGSFYTPREIVDFMVEESLVAHLKTKTNLSEEKLRSLSSYDLEDDAIHPMDQQERKLLVEAIHSTTILDPACGSGAFPIGVLQRLVHMLEVLDPECAIYLNKVPPEARRMLLKHDRNYIRKLGVIRECIHGVDIQPIAIDISRLRCFLTLVVDQHVDDNAPNRGIEPLPNLDFKFVCANTLIKPPFVNGEASLFGDEFAIALGELVDEYFAPVDQLHKLETARKLQQLISDKTKKELESIVKSYSYIKDEKHKKALAQKNQKNDEERLRINNLWGSYENIFQNKPVGFFDTRYFFPIVQRNGGFDIVIANPPYIEFKKLPSIEKKYLSSYKSAEGKYDAYVLFNELSISLLKDLGILCLIQPTTFLKKDFGKQIRNIIRDEFKIKKILDFSDIQVFEGATNYTGIFIFEKNNDVINYSFPYHQYFQSKKVTTPSEFQSSLNEEHSSAIKHYLTIDHTLLMKSVWNFQNDKINNFLEKVYFNSETLTKYTKSIFQGIASGKDEVFYVNESTVKEYSIEPEILVRLIKGKDLKRYKIEWSGFYVIYPYDHDSNVFSEEKLKDEFPNTYNYLLKQKYLLEDRDYFNKSSKKWFELWNQRNVDNFKEMRIVCPEISDKNNFVLTDAFYGNTKTYHIIPLDRSKVFYYYLLGLLNSKLLDFIYKKIATPQAGGFYAYKTQFLSTLPIKIAGDQKLFVEIVDKILAITKSSDYSKNSAKKEEVKEYERQIDQLVYILYDLTPEEIEIVEDSCKK